MINSEDLKIRGFHKNHWLSGYPHFRMVEPGWNFHFQRHVLEGKRTIQDCEHVGSSQMRVKKKSDRMKGPVMENHMGMGQNLVPLVNIKIAGKWMFIPLKMVLIGIDP